VGQAADGLERLSLSLADKRPEELLDGVRDFGRKHPLAFIAGGVLVGVALGRFVRSSEADSAPDFEFSPAYPLATAAYDDDSAAVGDGVASVAETSSFAADQDNGLSASEGTDADLGAPTLPRPGY
jgi:hypothetical protein